MALDTGWEEVLSQASADTGYRNAPPAEPVRILHVFPSFDIGGVPLRMVRIINHFGRIFHHSIIALDGNFSAADRLALDVHVELMKPPKKRRGMLRSCIASGRALRKLRPDLMATYNWGAIEWAIASRFSRIPRHIHFEAGFGQEEAVRQLRRRVLCRRWALSRCDKLVVPSRTLYEVARRVWQIPAQRVAFIPNGIDVDRFAQTPRDAVVGFLRRPGELVVGTIAPLRPEKNVGRLIRAFAMLDARTPVRLIIAGDGTERPGLAQLAADLGVRDNVIFTGQVTPELVLGAFDVFALSSDTEQMPNALIEAMAASRPVAAVDVGDVKLMLGEANGEFVVPRDNLPALAIAIGRLLAEPTLRFTLGRYNRERAITEYPQKRMFASYAHIFSTPPSS